jgi:hypothetical protein
MEETDMLLRGFVFLDISVTVLTLPPGNARN